MHLQVPGFFDGVAPGLLDRAWASIQESSASANALAARGAGAGGGGVSIGGTGGGGGSNGGGGDGADGSPSPSPSPLVGGGGGGGGGPEEYTVEGYRRALGIPALSAGASTRDVLEARWCRPSMSIVDMRPGGMVAAAGASTEACYRCAGRSGDERGRR